LRLVDFATVPSVLDDLVERFLVFFAVEALVPEVVVELLDRRVVGVFADQAGHDVDFALGSTIDSLELHHALVVIELGLSQIDFERLKLSLTLSLNLLEFVATFRYGRLELFWGQSCQRRRFADGRVVCLVLLRLF